jgi:ABC-type sugar transport system substrate-binding protein
MRAALLVRSAAVLLAAALALGLVVEAAPAPAPALAAQAPLRVRLGVVGGVSDAGFYVGLDKG